MLLTSIWVYDEKKAFFQLLFCFSNWSLLKQIYLIWFDLNNIRFIVHWHCCRSWSLFHNLKGNYMARKKASTTYKLIEQTNKHELNATTIPLCVKYSMDLVFSATMERTEDRLSLVPVCSWRVSLNRQKDEDECWTSRLSMLTKLLISIMILE